MRSSEIEKEILELTGEDDWGSWELWWKVAPDPRQKADSNLREAFVDTLARLVAEKKLIAKTTDASRRHQPTEFHRSRLESEIEQADSPDPETFYWFGID